MVVDTHILHADVMHYQLQYKCATQEKMPYNKMPGYKSLLY